MKIPIWRITTEEGERFVLTLNRAIMVATSGSVIEESVVDTDILNWKDCTNKIDERNFYWNRY